MEFYARVYGTDMNYRFALLNVDNHASAPIRDMHSSSCHTSSAVYVVQVFGASDTSNLTSYAISLGRGMRSCWCRFANYLVQKI
jgi:hypothetical protein